MKKQIGYIYPNKFLFKKYFKINFPSEFLPESLLWGLCYISPGILWGCFSICETRPAQSNDFSFIFLSSFICGQFFAEAGQGHIQRERLFRLHQAPDPQLCIRTVVLSFISYIISLQNFHLEQLVQNHIIRYLRSLNNPRFWGLVVGATQLSLEKVPAWISVVSQTEAPV